MFSCGQILSHCVLIVTIIVAQPTFGRLLDKCLGCPFTTEPRYGPEWTFTNDLIQKNPELRFATIGQVMSKLHSTWKALPEVDRVGRKIAIDLSKRTLTISDHALATPLTITFGVDDGVIEVVSTPLTEPEWTRLAGIVQKLVFESFYACGAKPANTTGGGHISVSINQFEPTLKGLAMQVNFVSEFLNNPEVHLGILYSGALNVAPVGMNESQFVDWNSDDFAYIYGPNLYLHSVHLDSLKAFRNDYSRFLRSLKVAMESSDNARTAELSKHFYRTIRRTGNALPLAVVFNRNNSQRLDIPEPGFRDGSERLEVKCLSPQRTMFDFLAGIHMLESVFSRTWKGVLGSSLIEFLPRSIDVWDIREPEPTNYKSWLRSYGKFTIGLPEDEAIDLISRNRAFNSNHLEAFRQGRRDMSPVADCGTLLVN